MSPEHTTTDLQRVAAIRRGDEDAFEALVDAQSRVLRSVAQAHCPGGSAEDVVQETWTTFLGALDRYEGRSSLRTYLIGICLNLARARGRKDRAESPLLEGPTVNPDRFQPDDAVWGGHWAAPPHEWPNSPEKAYLGKELGRKLQEAVDQLPEAQREVLVLRDVEGLSGEEACNILGVKDTHARVLLHRARAKVRAILEEYLGGRGA
jgi:RNA polymerase sigma-70 factor (ECF subfamily)